MMTADWSARAYLAFADERTRPVRDLLAAVPLHEAKTAVDLGCGPGNSTAVIAARYPGAEITGIDNSPDMIAKARQAVPSARFVAGDIAGWSADGEVDLVFSNAALHWIGGHETVLPHLAGQVRPGGALAIQMPDNLDEPVHRAMREVAAVGPWACKLGQAAAARTPLARADWYYRLLKPHCASVDVWRTVYHHPIPGGAKGVTAWFASTGLRPYLGPLEPAEQAGFLAAYEDKVAAALPTFADGSMLLPFPRLFIVAIR